LRYFSSPELKTRQTIISSICPLLKPLLLCTAWDTCRTFLLIFEQILFIFFNYHFLQNDWLIYRRIDWIEL
jgi:hypothetical protein